MIQTLDTSLCTGCSACSSICPTGAIELVRNQHGFDYPQVDQSKCIQCKKCLKVCQILHGSGLKYSRPTAKIAQCSDDVLRESSSSGGMMTLLAREIFATGGKVAGATWIDGKLRHILVSDEEGLATLRGSKYLQSEMGDICRQIKDLLDKSVDVLFIGTPCQVAGLRLYLKKPYEHLLTVDLVCYGVPSPGVFEHYLEERLTQNLDDILTVNFRNKILGWHEPCLKIGYRRQGDDTLCHYLANIEDDTYCQAFLQKLILQKVCSSCQFAEYRRVGDLTLGDAWGARYFLDNMDDGRGLSLVLVSTRKGFDMMRKLERHCDLSRTIKQKIAQNANPSLLSPVTSHPDRDLFFSNWEQGEFSTIGLLQEYLDTKKKVAVLNFHWENSNYGAVLTSYALNFTINQLGYLARNIDYSPSWARKREKVSVFEDFRNSHIPLTRVCENSADLQELNVLFDTFVVGSDQVWNPQFSSGECGIYQFRFTEERKKRIAYAASFGVSSYDEDVMVKLKVGEDLERFDHLSVREHNAVRILEQTFNCQAEHVLDPVFLMSRTQWEVLCEKVPSSIKKSGIYYFLDEKLQKEWCTRSKKEVCDAKNIRHGLSVQEWVAAFRDASYVVTDSFHAICFAIIFKKPFLCLINPNSSVSDRQYSLLRQFNLTSRLVSNYEDVKTGAWKQWSTEEAGVDLTIEARRRFSIDWLSRVLSAPKQSKLQANKDHMLHARIKELENTFLLPRLKRKRNYYRLLQFLHIGDCNKYRKKLRKLSHLIRSIKAS